MHLDELLAYAQPQARAAVFARNAGIGLLELGKKAADLVGRDADAGVRDPEAQQALLVLDRDLDAPLPGELERIAREVHQALCDAPGIAVCERNVRGHPGE